MAADIQFCYKAEHGPEGNSLYGLQDVFYLDAIPGAYSFGLSIALTGHNWNVPHSLRIELQGPDRETLLVIEEMMPVFTFDNRIPEPFHIVYVSFQILNMKVPAEGAYKARVYVDGILDGEKELYFAKVEGEYLLYEA